MNLLRDLIDIVRQMPAFYADRIDRWLLRGPHCPVDGGELPFCIGHRRPVPWPCREATEAADRIAARRVHAERRNPT